jgi:hypothetical protein
MFYIIKPNINLVISCGLSNKWVEIIYLCFIANRKTYFKK